MIPNEKIRALKYVLKTNWYWLLAFITFVGISTYAFLTSTGVLSAGLIFLVVLDFLILSVTIGSSIHSWKNARFVENVGGVEWIFYGRTNYAEREELQNLIDCVCNSFRPVLEEEPEKHLGGVEVHVLQGRPDDPANRVEKPSGLTYPFQRKTYVYGPEVLDKGTTGWELCLQIRHSIAPGRTEKEDLDYLKDNDIWPLGGNDES